MNDLIHHNTEALWADQQGGAELQALAVKIERHPRP